jgi:hypothetical protein
LADLRREQPGWACERLFCRDLLYQRMHDAAHAIADYNDQITLAPTCSPISTAAMPIVIPSSSIAPPPTMPK